MATRVLPALAAALLLPACLSPSTDGVAATPQRPTFSSATTTTADGTLELEAGLDYDHHDTSSIPATLKYGLASNAEVFLGGVPRARTPVGGGRDARGHGDTTIGARGRFWEDDELGLAAAVQVAARLPTGSHTKGFSDDEYAWFAAAILDWRIETWSWTAYHQLGALGDPSGGGYHTQRGSALAVSHPVDEVWTGYAELASVTTHARSDNPLFATAGLQFSENPRLVWDLGARFGLNDDGGDTALVAGFTVNFGRPGARDSATESDAAGN